MAFRPRFSGHTRWDDPTSDPDDAEPDVDLLPYDEDDQAYLERRRDAMLQHCREHLRTARLRQDAARVAAMWQRILERLEISEHWASGEGDQRLF